MFIALQVVYLALFVVGVIRSRGIARILLAVWVVVSAISTVINIVAPQLVDGIGISGFGIISFGVNFIGTVLLAIALILGRPGYHGEDDRPRYPGAPTVYGQQNHPGIAQPGQYGDQPYGSYEQPRSFGSAGDPYSVPDDRGDVRP